MPERDVNPFLRVDGRESRGLSRDVRRDRFRLYDLSELRDDCFVRQSRGHGQYRVCHCDGSVSAVVRDGSCDYDRLSGSEPVLEPSPDGPCDRLARGGEGQRFGPILAFCREREHGRHVRTCINEALICGLIPVRFRGHVPRERGVRKGTDHDPRTS